MDLSKSTFSTFNTKLLRQPSSPGLELHRTLENKLSKQPSSPGLELSFINKNSVETTNFFD